jgi:hypothetical protein
MALFFSLQTLEEQSCNDSHKFLTMLEFHYTKRLPKSIYSKDKPSKVSLAGNSFLLNPLDFFADKHTDTLYKLQYVKLAARRDYNLYKQYKYKALQTSFFPDLNIQAITYNPLLIVTPTELSFKYE